MESEIRTITGNNTSNQYYLNGNSSNTQTKGSNIYKWLFDRTNGCESYGCDTNGSSIGYWVATSATIDGNGFLYTGLGTNYTRDFRPVIIINQNRLQ